MQVTYLLSNMVKVIYPDACSSVGGKVPDTGAVLVCSVYGENTSSNLKCGVCTYFFYYYTEVIYD